MSARVCVLHAGGWGGDLLEPRGGQDASRATTSGLWWEVAGCPSVGRVAGKPALTHWSE